MNYRKAVSEGRRLLKRSEDDQWALARLTAEVLESGHTQREWAADLGVSLRHIGILKNVWTRYGDDRDRHPNRTFGEWYAMATLSEEKGARAAEVAEVTGVNIKSLVHGAGRGEKIEVARALLEDQRVVAGVMKDSVSRKSLRQAAEDADYLDRSEGPRREAAADIEAVAEVQERIMSVARALRTLSEINTDPDEFALQVRNREPELLETWDEAIPGVVSFLQGLRRRIKAVL